jgi:hypothetical protein
MDHSTRGLGTLSSPQRNHYFYGKLMDVPHFEMEQWYGNKKRWLLNRLGLGYGVLCGLGLTINENKVCIAPGVAIDRYGREIIVPHEVCIDPWAVTDECGRPKASALSKTEEHQVYFCLAYRECQTDFMPVLVTDCNVQQNCLPGTTVESYLVLVKEGEAPKPTRLEKVCEILNSDQAQSIKRNKLCELLSKERCFLSADNEICVVLGRARLRADGTIGALDPCSARTTLISNERLFDMLLCLTGPRGGDDTPPVREDLTRIARFVGVALDNNDRPVDLGGVGATSRGVPGSARPRLRSPRVPAGVEEALADSERILHDQTVQAADFPSQLVVTFSGNIPTFPSHGKAWFIVTLEIPGLVGQISASHLGASGSTSGFSTVVYLDGIVQLVGAKATFTIDKNFVTEIRRKTNSPAAMNLLCRVTVKCDFLLDSNGKAVDGNHLGGTLPSGDGVPGGDFESWFTVTIPPSPAGPVN